MSEPADRRALPRALARLALRLRAHLAHLRARGRTAAADRLGGLVIEPGEPEQILASLVDEGDSRGDEAAVAPLADGLPGFLHAQAVYGLHDLERDALFIAVAPELEVRFARLFGFLNDSVIALRPTIGLAAALLDGAGAPGRTVRAFLPGGALTRFALATTATDGPLAAKSYAVPAALWPRLVGTAPAAAAAPLTLDDLVLSSELRARAEAAIQWWTRQPDGVLVVEGAPGTGREALIGAIAWAAGRPTYRGARGPVWPTPSELARDARWHAGVAAVIDPSGDVVRQLIDAPVAVAIAAATTAELGLAGVTRPTFIVRVPPLAVTERMALWRRAEPSLDETACAHLAGRFRLGPARIAEVVSRARDEVVGPPGRAELEEAAATASALRFDGLAARVSGSPDIELIVPAATRRELDTAQGWAAHRRRLLGESGPGRHLGMSAGLVCLFWGQPGTGKTLAARHLAGAAGLELYRVDLAQVVSKYVGETEKHLAAVLDECERSDVALLFDEADALFGKRTEVKDAHDRYANIETGFLLQRLETTTALVVLTSNLHQNLDPAFARRVHVAAEFPPPRVAERTLLWRALLPAAWTLHPAIEIAYLASHDLRGGEIRNAVAAALLACGGDDGDHAMPFLVWAVCRELHKAGRLVIADEFGPWSGLVAAIAAGHPLAPSIEQAARRP